LRNFTAVFFRAALSARAAAVRPRHKEGFPMLYAIFCYNDEDVVFSWSKAQDDAVMGKLNAVHQNLAKNGKLGPAVRLMPTTTATTVRKEQDPPLVLDGPFAETKEQLLGFYVVDCATLDEVVEFARDLGRANPGGAYEIRPVRLYVPGSDMSDRS
jgi:hypothetical protein